MKTIYWLRSDLRTQENQALSEFLKQPHGELIYAETKSSRGWSTPKRKLRDDALLDLELRLKRSITRVSTSVIEYLKSIPSPELILWTKEYAVWERQEEEEVKQWCQNEGVWFREFDQQSLVAEADLPFSLESMPFVFTDFKNKLGMFLVRMSSELTYDEYSAGGESIAIKRLQTYFWDTKAVSHYKETRNGMIELNDSSKFSPWLALGCLSPRSIYQQLLRFESQFGRNPSTEHLVYELLWRDYFKFFSKKYGAKIFIESGVRPLVFPRQTLRDREQLKKWCEGQTGEDFVDANMRELNLTGWMSNRGRQNVASYLLHDLKLPWTWGARYFEEKLIDYDPDLNWGNWLYFSGYGSDPRSRKFNVKSQAEAYDGAGEYRKKWLT